MWNSLVSPGKGVSSAPYGLVVGTGVRPRCEQVLRAVTARALPRAVGPAGASQLLSLQSPGGWAEGPEAPLSLHPASEEAPVLEP